MTINPSPAREDAAGAREPESTKALAPAAELSVVGLAIVLLRNRVMIALSCGIVLVLASPVILLQSATYTATAAFMPQSRPASSAFGALAAQFGGSGLLGLQTAQPAAFYAALARSRGNLEVVARTQFSVATDTGTVTGPLFHVLQVRGRSDALRVDNTVRLLGDMVSSVTEQKTGLVKVAITSPYATLSADIARRIINLVDQFNLQTRQSQAAAERRFTEQRLAEVQLSLRQAEDRLQQFLQRNRNYQNSPELSFDHDRLERELTLRQQVYQQLTQAVEQARIEEVRDTPVITVVEHPVAPVRPDGRGWTRKSVLALFLGASIGIVLAFGREAVHRGDNGPDTESAEARRLVSEVIRDLSRPWRALRGLRHREAQKRA